MSIDIICTAALHRWQHCFRSKSRECKSWCSGEWSLYVFVRCAFRFLSLPQHCPKLKFVRGPKVFRAQVNNWISALRTNGYCIHILVSHVFKIQTVVIIAHFVGYVLRRYLVGFIDWRMRMSVGLEVPGRAWHARLSLPGICVVWTVRVF